jgi:hypothetical protein
MLRVEGSAKKSERSGAGAKVWGKIESVQL